MSQGLRSDQFSFSSLVLMAVSASFGSGIFFSVSVTAGYVPHPTTIMFVWLAGGVISLTGSLTFAEIGARIPETGGVYAYLRQMYGNAVAFLYGWASLLVITTGAIAALSLVFVSNLSLLVPISEPMRPVAACVFIALLALVNILSNRLSSFMAVTGTLLKIAGVLLIVFTAFAVGSSKPDLVYAEQEFSWTAFGMAMIGAMWAYGGWHHVAALSGEAKDGARKIPLALFFGALIITAIYLLVNWAYLSALSPMEIAESKSPAFDIMRQRVPWAAKAMTMLIALSVLVTAGVYTVASPRVYFRMAEDKLFFRWLAFVHPRTNTPLRAILVQALWSMVLVIGWQKFSKAIEYVTITDWVFLLMTGFGIFILRRKEGVHQGFRVPLFPVLPMVYVCAVVAFIAAAMWMQPKLLWAFLVVVATGFGVYLLYRRFRW